MKTEINPDLENLLTAFSPIFKINYLTSEKGETATKMLCLDHCRDAINEYADTPSGKVPVSLRCVLHQKIKPDPKYLGCYFFNAGAHTNPIVKIELVIGKSGKNSCRMNKCEMCAKI